MSYAERAIEIKKQVDEAVASNAGYDELEKYVQPYEEICKEILIKENFLDDDIYLALKTIKFTNCEDGEFFQYDYEMPFFDKCLSVFIKTSEIIGLELKGEDAESKLIKINNIEYRILEAFRLYGEKEKELEGTASSMMYDSYTI
ncbi:hypothetical protein [Pseudomonas aeruginosa]|uniref:hypothetical protein n=1 Tax=Pseudomonas aeruginosa TaxID=287 RepID=UPI0021F1F39A|nr:hypothetical protein [Pseudomonas aeruginosa]MCV6408541.1 hypothetical protein [Pseudomonas aeruginosa]